MQFLYLPTSTLNFNAIFSMGAISPAAIYNARDFGNKTLETVEPNPFTGALLLYEKCPKFSIDDPERDNYPLILRLKKEELPEIEEVVIDECFGVKVYACEETIYFDPISTRIFFASDADKQITLSKSKPSLTTKLVDLFRPCMGLLCGEKESSFEWSSDILDGVEKQINGELSSSIKTDQRIDRLKGFMAGYLIGACKSVAPEIAAHRRLIRDMRNFFSANRRDSSFLKFKDEIMAYESGCAKLDEYLARAGGDGNCPDLSGDGCFKVNSSRIVEISDSSVQKTNQKSEFLQLVNEFGLAGTRWGDFDESRLPMAKEGAAVFRAHAGSLWEGSTERKYINDLLNNIKSGREFRFSSTRSQVLQAFAAFMLKGDDLERLESFLVSQQFADFRVAFGLWGAKFGFYKFPKTFYNYSISNDRDYLEQLHHYVHRLIHVISQESYPGLMREETEKAPMLKTESPEYCSQRVLDRLLAEMPEAKQWKNKLEELASRCNGINETFLKELNVTRVKELGGSKQGVTKKDVVAFFKKELEEARSKEEQECGSKTFALTSPSDK